MESGENLSDGGAVGEEAKKCVIERGGRGGGREKCIRGRGGDGGGQKSCHVGKGGKQPIFIWKGNDGFS